MTITLLDHIFRSILCVPTVKQDKQIKQKHM